jgi:hypothetical protein
MAEAGRFGERSVIFTLYGAMPPVHSSKSDRLNYGKFDIGVTLSFMSAQGERGDRQCPRRSHRPLERQQ